MKEVNNVEKYYLHPGYIKLYHGQGILQTVVGSCVAVCLWDKKRKIGAMNHFLFPVTRRKDKATPKYGNVAMIVLTRMMFDEGCQPENVKAHIIGGGYPEGTTEHSIGKENVRIATEALHQKGIRITSADIGGTVGRKILFDVETGEIAVLKVQKIREEDWRRHEGMEI